MIKKFYSYPNRQQTCLHWATANETEKITRLGRKYESRQKELNYLNRKRLHPVHSVKQRYLERKAKILNAKQLKKVHEKNLKQRIQIAKQRKIAKQTSNRSYKSWLARGARVRPRT